MSESDSTPTAQLIEVSSGQLEAFTSTREAAGPPIVAAHPASALSGIAANLLSGIAERTALCINPRGLGGSSLAEDRISMEEMVDDLETARLALDLEPWIFWGMSGGGWLALTYAQRHPEGLRGIIVESACACFRERLADPTCALSPFFPAWWEPLTDAGCLVEGSHDAPSDATDAVWQEIEGAGQVFRRPDGSALLVSPAPLDAAMMRAMPMLWTFDAREWLPNLQIPALVIAGGSDPVVPAPRVRAVHESLSGSSYVEIEGGGHVPSTNGSTEAAEAVREFLKTLS